MRILVAGAQVTVTDNVYHVKTAIADCVRGTPSIIAVFASVAGTAGVSGLRLSLALLAPAAGRAGRVAVRPGPCGLRADDPMFGHGPR